MEKENLLYLTTEDGTMIEAEILFTHHSDKFNANYVVFLPKDEEEYSAAKYIETDGANGQLEPIETDEEWALLEGLLNDYFESLDDEEEDVD